MLNLYGRPMAGYTWDRLYIHMGYIAMYVKHLLMWDIYLCDLYKTCMGYICDIHVSQVSNIFSHLWGNLIQSLTHSFSL